MDPILIKKNNIKNLELCSRTTFRQIKDWSRNKASRQRGRLRCEHMVRLLVDRRSKRDELHNAQPEVTGLLFVYRPANQADVYLHYLAMFTSTGGPE